MGRLKKLNNGLKIYLILDQIKVYHVDLEIFMVFVNELFDGLDISLDDDTEPQKSM